MNENKKENKNMVKLEEILHKPLEYDEDVRIIALPDLQYALRVYDSHGRGWGADTLLSTSQQVNDLLVPRGYRQQVMQGKELVFAPQWYFRIARPEWKLFSQWLYVWYAFEREVGTQRGSREGNTYLEIMEKLYDKNLSLKDRMKWAGKKAQETYTKEDQTISNLYDELEGILISYKAFLRDTEGGASNA